MTDDAARARDFARTIVNGLACKWDSPAYRAGGENDIAAALLAAEARGRVAGRRGGIEEAAHLIESTQETTSNTDDGNYLSPRSHGNLVGLSYVAGIRALAEKEPQS